ncbi:hypothetical protein Tco_1415042, partial [Tanacetum coccineum]
MEVSRSILYSKIGVSAKGSKATSIESIMSVQDKSQALLNVKDFDKIDVWVFAKSCDGFSYSNLGGPLLFSLYLKVNMNVLLYAPPLLLLMLKIERLTRIMRKVCSHEKAFSCVYLSCDISFM